VTILPPRFNKEWNNWLGNIRDWCVSRQLWWGHRIPVWYVEGDDAEDAYYVARSEDDAYAAARAERGADVVLHQDEDVLDTWFSSGLWPFATVGWPAENDAPAPDSDLARFYPASCLETGYDILFFWVARMVMLGINLTGKAPFETIYMHGLVRDGKGKKMSKTTGNVIDPLDTIGNYGADALRFSLVTGVTPGQDVPLSMEKVEANRNFANKLWNAGRYLISTVDAAPAEERAALAADGAAMGAAELATLGLAERHIVSTLHELVDEVTASLEAYNFGDAGQRVSDFLWDDYAGWYLEASKTRVAEGGAAATQSRRTLVYVFGACVRLLHPFMPFVTEALWQELPRAGSGEAGALIVSDWPALDGDAPLPRDGAAVAQFEALKAAVRAVRNARADYQVEPGKKIGATLRVADPALRAALEAERETIALVGRLAADALVFAEPAPVAAGAKADTVRLVVADGVDVDLPLADLVDVVKERKRLEKRRKALEKDFAGLEKRLGAPGFADKAPPAVVQKTEAEFADLKGQLAEVGLALKALD
jgi:valyl-tRNA synthetase